MQYSHLTYIKRCAHGFRRGLSDRLDEIYISDFPTTGPRKVIRLLQDILIKTGEEIDKASSERTVVLTSLLIRSLGQLLQVLENAHTGQTPRGLVQLIETLTKPLNPNELLLAYPQAPYNYTIANLLELLKQTLQNALPAQTTHELLKQFTGPISIVSFPRIERDNVLMHAVFGHEIGHPVAAQFLAHERTTQKYKDELKIAQDKIAALVASRSAGANQIEQLKLSQQLLSRVLTLRERALQELISDYVGILLFGPSAFFAFHNLFIVADWDFLPAPNEYYPPPRYRMRLMNGHLESEGYAQCVRDLASRPEMQVIVSSAVSLADEIVQRCKVTNDQDKIKADPLISVAYAWVENTIAPAIEFAKNKVTSSYSAGTMQNEVPELLRRLELGVPPNETGNCGDGNPVDLRSAIVAGWFCSIHGNKAKGGTSVAFSDQDNSEIQRLTLRALEYITLQTAYKKKFPPEQRTDTAA